MKRIILILFFLPMIFNSLNAKNNYLKKADKYFKEGKFSLAEIFYKKVITSEPDNYKANLNLGKIYFYQDEYKKALKYFNTANDIKSNKKTKFLIANTYVMINKPETAISMYSNILKSNPNYSDVYLNAGLVSFKKLYNKKLTIYFWENFLRVAPNDIQAPKIKKVLQYLKDPNFVLKPPVNISATTKKSNDLLGNNTNASNIPLFNDIKIEGKDIISGSETRYKIKDKKMITTD